MALFEIGRVYPPVRELPLDGAGHHLDWHGAAGLVVRLAPPHPNGASRGVRTLVQPASWVLHGGAHPYPARSTTLQPNHTGIWAKCTPRCASVLICPNRP